MTKRIFLTLSALALVFSLAACGVSSSNEETSTDPSASESTPETESSSEEDDSEQKPQDEQFSPMTLVDNDQVTVKITAIEPKDFWGYTLKVFLENKTDKELMFTTDDVSVNGFMCDPFWAASVTAGKKANEDISFSEGDFEKNGIASVEEIVFTLRIYDSNDFVAEDVFKETFTVKP